MLRVKRPQAIEFVGGHRRQAPTAAQELGEFADEAGERPGVSFLGRMKIESLLAFGRVFFFLLGLECAEIVRFDGPGLPRWLGLRMRVPLTFVSLAGSQIDARLAVEVDFLQVSLAAERIVLDNHPVAAQVEIHFEEAIVKLHVRVVTADRPRLTMMKEAFDAVEIDLPLGRHAPLQTSLEASGEFPNECGRDSRF